MKYQCVLKSQDGSKTMCLWVERHEAIEGTFVELIDNKKKESYRVVTVYLPQWKRT